MPPVFSPKAANACQATIQRSIKENGSKKDSWKHVFNVNTLKLVKSNNELLETFESRKRKEKKKKKKF